MPTRKRKTKPEPPPDIFVWTAALRDDHLVCRDIGHRWAPGRAWVVDGGGGYERTMRCTRCRTERHQVLTLGGHVVSNRYNYVDGYLAPKGAGAFDMDARDHLRLESIGRAMTRQGKAG